MFKLNGYVKDDDLAAFLHLTSGMVKEMKIVPYHPPKAEEKVNLPAVVPFVRELNETMNWSASRKSTSRVMEELSVLLKDKTTFGVNLLKRACKRAGYEPTSYHYFLKTAKNDKLVTRMGYNKYSI